MKPLFWEEEPASKPIIRATYFLQKGHGWLPYSEKDSELLEVLNAFFFYVCRYNTLLTQPTTHARRYSSRVYSFCTLWMLKCCARRLTWSMLCTCLRGRVMAGRGGLLLPCSCWACMRSCCAACLGEEASPRTRRGVKYRYIYFVVRSIDVAACSRMNLPEFWPMLKCLPSSLYPAGRLCRSRMPPPRCSSGATTVTRRRFLSLTARTRCV